MDVWKNVLKQSRTKKENYNFVSLYTDGFPFGGKFMITKNEFFNAYAKVIDVFSPLFFTGVVWRQPQRLHLPAMLDFDLRSNTNQRVPQEPVISLVEQICYDFQRITNAANLFVLVTRKPTIYQKRSGIWADGFHLYILGVQVTTELLMAFRVACFPLLERFKQENPHIVNSVSDIMDEKLCNRKNGLILLLDQKSGPNKFTGGPHNVIFWGSYDVGWVTEHIMSPGQTSAFLKENAQKLYSWLFEDPLWKKVGAMEKVTTALVPCPRTCRRADFNLSTFLELTSTHTPSYQEYLQVIYFCASLQMDEEFVISECNRAWQPTNLNETRNVYRSFKNPAVGKGSIMRYLQLHANAPFELKDIFPQKVFKFYSEYNDFLYCYGHVWSPDIIRKFCSDTFAFINGSKKFVYQDEISKKDKYCNSYTEVSVYLTDKAPFSGTDHLVVNTELTRAQLCTVAGAAMPKKTSENSDDIKKRSTLTEFISGVRKSQMSLTAAKAQLVACGVKIPESLQPMRNFFKEMMEKGFVKRYKNMEFLPYLFTDPTPDYTYNLFSPYPLLSYRPTGAVDWKETSIYEWLWKCYADENKETMDWLLKLLAFWLQFPNLRSERIFVLFSISHGVGKGTFFSLLSGLFSKNLCAFYNNYLEFVDPFDLPTANKKFQFLDDVSGITRTQAQALNARTTSTSKKFNQKNEKMVWLNLCDELIVTSNDINPMYCSVEDRRQCYILVNDSYKQDRAFFKRVRAEFDDLNVMKSFFDMLCQLDVTGWWPTPDKDPFQGQTNKQKLRNLASGICFILDFFSDPDWIQRYSNHVGISYWARDFEIHALQQRVSPFEKGTVRIRFTQSRLYDMYKCFMRDKCSRQRVVKSTTFWEQIKCLGIEPKSRQRLHHKLRNTCDIYFAGVQTGMQNIQKEYIMKKWPTEIKAERDDFIRLVGGEEAKN